MELEETIERLTLKAITSSAEAPDYPNCIVMKKDLINILNHLTKQDKMIELMTNYMDDNIPYNRKTLCLKYGKEHRTQETIRKYFEKEAEEAK